MHCQHQVGGEWQHCSFWKLSFQISDHTSTVIQVSNDWGGQSGRSYHGGDKLQWWFPMTLGCREKLGILLIYCSTCHMTRIFLVFWSTSWGWGGCWRKCLECFSGQVQIVVFKDHHVEEQAKLFRFQKTYKNNEFKLQENSFWFGHPKNK